MTQDTLFKKHPPKIANLEVYRRENSVKTTCFSQKGLKSLSFQFSGFSFRISYFQKAREPRPEDREVKTERRLELLSGGGRGKRGRLLQISNHFFIVARFGPSISFSGQGF